MPAGGYDLITSTTISGNTTNEVSFSGLPSTYTNLVLFFYGYEPNGNTSDVYLRANGSTSNVYSPIVQSYEQSSNLTMVSQALVSRADITTASSWKNTQNNFGWVEYYNYNSASLQKTYLARFVGGTANGSNAIIDFASGNFNITAALTSIQIGLTSTSRYFGDGSRFWLYGIYGV
jgi:hypothetical protein